MAIPDGGFKGGAAGITPPGGGYSYLAGLLLPHYFAGIFFIDTGYDDPVLWTAGVQAAEVYGARVYATAGTIAPAQAAGVYTGKWHIEATPVWQSKFWVSPHGNTTTQKRILIKCECYLLEPVSTTASAWQRLESADWSLYRL
jgi:hypothetical protein